MHAGWLFGIFFLQQVNMYNVRNALWQKSGVNGTSEVVIDQDGKVDQDHSAHMARRPDSRRAAEQATSL
jgi:hypothetical protein